MFEYTIPFGENFEISIDQLILGVLVIVLARWLLRRLKRMARNMIDEESHELLPQTFKYARIALICLVIILLVLIFKVDDLVDGNSNTILKISNLLWLFLVFLVARLADNFFGEFLKQKALNENYKAPSVSGVQYFVWLLLGGLILRQTEFDMSLGAIGEAERQVHISQVMWALASLVFAHVLSTIIIHVFLSRYYRVKEIDIGAQYALNTLLRYFIYMIATIVAIQRLGFDANAIWGALAGAAIVIGIGLQNVVNDFASGVLLLFERAIVVGNVVKVDNIVGRVKKIGIRASILETRDDTNMIIPNSHLVSNNVINWDYEKSRVKFYISVGVAYGSDTELVKAKLLEALNDNSHILRKPAPFVWFKSFDDSSLTFELHYWSRHLMNEEQIKSEIRFKIDALFRSAGIEIPFPQRVVHMPK